ncbi:glyoxalase superfamily protein [Pseudomonas sp. C11]|uniref:glyoxalase superfamily protein n=1 Tax=Pseudomonas sp. C11 TaxID=3075550 RepID=UPI002AFF4090|nr:glyoxalase superfamily protein [Pseudomonas sp. C11]
MARVFTEAQVERFKREAKKLRHFEPDLTHSAALDRIAAQQGFSNWSLLHRHCECNDPRSVLQSISVAPLPLMFQRTPEEMRQTLRKLPERSDSNRPVSAEVRAQTEDIRGKFVSAVNALDYAIAYMGSLLSVPRFHINASSLANWEMRCWLPYSIHPIADDDDFAQGQILVNRRYKPVGQTSDEWTDYREHTRSHLKLDASQLKDITGNRCRQGYLFNDGSCPWHSRKLSEGYLERLLLLRDILRG